MTTHFFTEDKLTVGKRTIQVGRVSLHDEAAIMFARRERLRKLKRDDKRETALLIDGADLGAKWDDSTSWTLTLRFQGRAMSTKYTMGSAHLSPPAFWEVLHSLLMDISGIEDETFDSWCDNLGMSNDSREAERIFNACRDTLPLVRRLLGRDFDRIRALDEDDIKAEFENIETMRSA